MAPDAFLERVLDPGLDFLESLGGPKVSNHARRFLLAVAIQEVGPKLEARYQNSPAQLPGPARGFWQFEQGGGCAGVIAHAASKALAERVCRELSVVCVAAHVWRAIEGHDLLAASFARLLLWTDRMPLPTEREPAWICYRDRLWRPGKPHPDAWPGSWRTASAHVDGT